MKKLKNIFFGVFVVFVFLLLVNISRVIPINSITCQSQYGPCSVYVGEAIRAVRLTNLHDVSENIKKALESELLVSKFSVRFNLPGNLRVYVVERKPVAAFTNPDLSEFNLLDEDGVVIGRTTKTNLPVIIVNGGQDVEKIAFASRIMTQMFTTHGVKLGKIENESLQLQVSDGISVIFPLEGEIDVLIPSLEVILSRLNTQGQNLRIESIDLRYKNPVLNEKKGI